MDYTQYNDKMKAAAKALAADVKTKAGSFGITHRPNSPSASSSIAKITSSTRQKLGAVSSLGIKFPRHLVFVHKGAGKGRGGTKGSRWKDKFGQTQKTNPRSFGKMGTGGRTEKPFIDAALNGPNGIDNIAAIAATELGAFVTGNLFIK